MKTAEYYKESIKELQGFVQGTRSAEARIQLVKAIRFAQNKIRRLAKFK